MKQEEAARALKILSYTGVTIDEFASKTGMKAKSLYTYLSRPERMSEIKAEYIIWSIERNYPTQYCFIEERGAFLKI